MRIGFTLNGLPAELDVSPSRRVVDLIREDLGLTGTKEGCGSGECGACTVLIDGEPRLGCLMIASQLDGRSVTTIEGISKGPELHPIQSSFIERGAIQCGFCTPGMVLSAMSFLERNPKPTREQIREALSGHLCRCAGYSKVVDAVACVGQTTAGPGRAAASARTDSGSGSMTGWGPPPASIPELLSMLDREPGAVIMAGGTDLLVKARERGEVPRALIRIDRISELKEVSDCGGFIRVGACATHSELITHPLVSTHLGVLKQALSLIGSPQIRSMGTIGGNVCTASPAGDSLPPLYAMGAELVLRSTRSERVVSIADFILGPAETSLAPGEVLVAIMVKKPVGRTIHHFEKVGARRAQACSLVSFAALVTLSERGFVETARFAFGSVGPTVVVIPEAEESLVGRKLEMDALNQVSRIVRRHVSPMGDHRADLEYRRTVAGNLVLRLGGAVE